jgi:hypothetical protein
MRSYKPEELFDTNGRLRAELAALAPQGDRRMGANPHTNGGLLLRDLHMPDFRTHAVVVPAPAAVSAEDTSVLGEFLRDVARSRNLRWSPAQIAHRLPVDFSDDASMRISHEAIYQALYVQGRGALRRELVACLRTGRALRVPQARSRQQAWAHVTEEVLLRERPAEAQDRAVPGHWESQWCCQAAVARAGGCSVEVRLSRSRAQRTSMRRRAMTAWVWVRPCSRFLR